MMNSMFVFLLMFSASSQAFSVLPTTAGTGTAYNTKTNNNNNISSTRLNNFFKNAFANDDSLGKPQNAGLTKGPNKNENVTLNGKKVPAIVGQKVSVVAAQNRVKIAYSCQKGDCGTCTISMNGRMVKACQAVIPSGKCDMKTL